ncbi:Uncharacterized protein TCM_021029 [Theobroma cacao]|uniref:F-box domain-containing protein n=1 Tax=Theobroma cacao TaxID=3641 RepID=A0A061EPF3_THECC|nr:Uncharacterized protein TCM_021029 [Theobroma cacao]
MAFQAKGMTSTASCSSTKRRRKSHDSSTPVDQVPADMLWSISNRLDIIDIIQAKVVCSSWNSLGEELVPRTPWLMLPSKEELERGYDVDDNAYSGFLKLGESQLRAYIIQKAILAGEPDCNNKKYGVILLCDNAKIAYHESKESCWTEVPNARHPPCQDIICHENHLFALVNYTQVACRLALAENLPGHEPPAKSIEKGMLAFCVLGDDKCIKPSCNGFKSTTTMMSSSIKGQFDVISYGVNQYLLEARVSSCQTMEMEAPWPQKICHPIESLFRLPMLHSGDIRVGTTPFPLQATIFQNAERTRFTFLVIIGYKQRNLAILIAAYTTLMIDQLSGHSTNLVSEVISRQF